MQTSDDKTRSGDRSRRGFLGATAGTGSGLHDRAASRAGRHGFHRRPATGSTSRGSASAAWAEATLPPSAGSVPTSSPSAMLTTSAAPARSMPFPKLDATKISARCSTRKRRPDRRRHGGDARPYPRRRGHGGHPRGQACVLPEAADAHALRVPRADQGRTPGRRRHPDGQPGPCHRGCAADQRVDPGRGHRTGPRGARLVRSGRPPVEAGDRPAQGDAADPERRSTGTSGLGRSRHGLITRPMPP